MDLLGEMQASIAVAREIEGLKEFADLVQEAVDKLGEVGLHMGASAMSPDVMKAFAFAYPFMEVTGDVVMAWMLLWRATVAAQKLEKGARKKDVAFYEGQLKSTEFFVHSILPTTMGKFNAILTTNGAAVEILEDSFGG